VEFPEWLVIRPAQLKAKLASVIILVMAVTFLEHLTEWSGGKRCFTPRQWRL
jgi:uncharacterized membrane protein YqhA